MWNWLKNIIKTFSAENKPGTTVATIMPVSSQAHVSTPSVIINPPPQLKPARTKKESTPAAKPAKDGGTPTKKPIRRTAKRTSTIRSADKDK